jgi:hypothetical protein
MSLLSQLLRDKKNCDVDVKLFDVPNSMSLINFVIEKFGYIAK